MGKERSSNTGGDALSLAEKVLADYRDYFLSEFPVRDENLRTAISTFASSPKSPIFRGPYVEVTRIEPDGRKKEDFPIDKRILARLPFSSPYPHQAESWTKLGNGSQMNLVLTSGTGTGKTESLLVPMISDLLKSPSQKGLQAILIYPMNALLNDQHKRLTETEGGKIPLLDPAWGITAKVYSGEIAIQDRMEMQTNPPTILLTNYKMLELMLLRGEFKKMVESSGNSRLRWMFYDELHTYIGVKGAEVAYLNRRLREAAKVLPKQLHAIAASATTGKEQLDKEKLIRFASRFFGTEFSQDSIVGFPDSHEPKAPPQFSFDLEKLTVETKRNLEDALMHSFWGGRSIEDAAKRWLPNDASRKANSETENALEIQTVLKTLWPSDRKADKPSIEHRAHLLVSGAIRVSSPIGVRQFDFLAPKSESEPHYSIGLCRECGAHGWIARIHESGNLLDNNGRKPGAEPGAVWITTEPFEGADLIDIRTDTERSLILAEPVPRARRGRATPPPEEGAKRLFVLNIDQNEDGTGRGFTRCPFCAAVNPMGEQIRPILSGASSNITNLSASVLRHADQNERRLLVFADSRQDVALQAGFSNQRSHRLAVFSLLAKYTETQPVKRLVGNFSFLPFFDWCAAQIPVELIPAAEKDKRRQAAWLTLADAELRTEYFDKRSIGNLSTEPNSAEMTELEKALDKHLIRPTLTTESTSQTSPEIVCYIAVDYRGRNGTEIKQAAGDLTKVSPDFSQETATWLIRVMLDKFRATGLRTRFIANVDGPAGNGRMALLANKGRSFFESQISKIIPDFNTRADEDRITLAEQFLNILQNYNYLRKENNHWLLQDSSFMLATEGDIHECPKCRRLRFIPKGQIASGGPCINSRCDGAMTILPLETREQFFYYRLGHLVRESTPLHAVEHSGWVEGERRQKIEALFNNSSPGSAEVNLVVASPTLEMGVDLKKLPAVLLRNVPPSPASYRQRIGRAGRESKAGLAITHTRASPYDSMFFDEPNRLIKGRIGSLIMPIDNQLVISRHVYAHLLETAPSEILESLRFWRNLMFDDSSPQSEMSLEAVPSPTRFTERLIVPLSRHAIEKKDELNRVFSNCNPEDIEKIGLGVEGRLRPILDYWCIRYQQLVVEIRKASAANLTIGGASGDEASRAVKRARNQLLTHLGFNRQNGYKSVRDWAPLFFLADRGFLPRYEFPGDTLALTCFSSKEDPYEVLDDKFKAHRDWAPSAQKDRFVWALGGKFRPAYFRVEAEGKIPDRIRVCRDHNFISKNIEDVCPSCTSTSTATINLTPLQPIKVDATRDGAIGDDSEDRGVAGLDIQTYITADNGTFLDTLSEEASVNPAAGVALLHKRSNTRVIQIVSPSRFGNAETYEYCELCSALRTPPRQADQDTPAQWHSRKCPRFNQPPANGQNQSGVVLMAERERTDAIELRLPPVFGFEGDFEDSDIDIHRSLLEALLRSAREVCELGPRGEGIAADVFNDRENFLIFYDPIEGGSGTIKELWHRRDEWFETALSRVADRIDGQTNGCDCERACDRCLLDYGNQRFHLRISRHAAKRILQAFKHENKFWSESVKSSKSPDISDPVSYDNSSPLEKYFAEMVSWHFGVRGSQLRSQMDAFPHERITRPDYQSGINNRFLFIDGRDPHEKWEVLTEDFRKRNLMTFRGKAWTVLTHTSLRNCQSIIPATLKWLGVTNEVPATWSPLPPMQHGQFDNRTLNTQQVNEIVSIFKSALHMHSSGESSDFSVVDPIIGADVWSLNGFGNLFSFTDSDGKNCVVRYAVKDEYNFHDYQLGNAVMAINDISVYQVALSNQEWSKIRDVVSVVKAQI